MLDAEKRYEGDLVALIHYDDEHHRIAILNVPQLARQERGSAGVAHCERAPLTQRILLVAEGLMLLMATDDECLKQSMPSMTPSTRAYEQADQVRLIARVRGRSPP